MSERDPRVAEPPDFSSNSSFPHPTRIGPYRILQVIGEGGMGIVYAAAQVEPVRRRVAVKMMKVGMDTKEVVARFEAERQALAVMDHPGIARVLDVGATEAGRPYFAMEYVPGVPLNEYCDQHKLGTAERVQLFISICQAVQHAHQKGVIHRDLKPSNVLVTEQDGRPAPKIIDFGIAKAISQHLTDRTLVTAFGIAIGTPAYMSPEQAEMSGLDVDTRTDIYSLGVMLYELLVGQLPTDPKEHGLPGFIARLVARETDAPTPSSKVSASGNAQGVAALRGTSATSLRKELKGDLDWIVMKAMDKDRARRYETANGLAMDLQRYLANEPVVARPPSAGYRAAKFVRRHRAVVIAAAAAVLALVVGALLATAEMIRVTRAEAQTRREAETAQQVSDFLVSLFEVSDPSEARGNTITAREILDRGAQKIETGLTDQPRVQARLLTTMGSVFRALGLYRDASRYYTEALQARLAILPPHDVRVLTSMVHLAEVESRLGDYATAESLLIQVRERGNSADAGDSLLATVESDLAVILYRQGRYAAAAESFRRVVEARERMFGPEDLHVASALRNLGGVSVTLGNYEEGERQLRRALAIAERVYDADSPDLFGYLSNVGAAEQYQKHYREAEAHYRRALTIAEKTYGPTHENVSVLLVNLGGVLEDEEKYHEALPLLERALKIDEAALGPDHGSVAHTLASLGDVYYDLGRYAEAEAAYRRSLTIRKRVMGPDHPEVAQVLEQLATTLHAMGRDDSATTYEARARRIRDAAGSGAPPP
jgi:tetratricopeptide (TPR) repeat protein/tRNA A-37 threonylcarbamoyl transferase component Bud32